MKAHIGKGTATFFHQHSSNTPQPACCGQIFLFSSSFLSFSFFLFLNNKQGSSTDRNYSTWLPESASRISARSFPSRFFCSFSCIMSSVYRKGFKAELSGSTKMAMATLTSPDTAVPVVASRPSKPTGKFRYGDSNEATGHSGVQGLLAAVQTQEPVGFNGQIDNHLTRSD